MDDVIEVDSEISFHPRRETDRFMVDVYTDQNSSLAGNSSLHNSLYRHGVSENQDTENERGLQSQINSITGVLHSVVRTLEKIERRGTSPAEGQGNIVDQADLCNAGMTTQYEGSMQYHLGQIRGQTSEARSSNTTGHSHLPTSHTYTTCVGRGVVNNGYYGNTYTVANTSHGGSNMPRRGETVSFGDREHIDFSTMRGDRSMNRNTNYAVDYSASENTYRGGSMGGNNHVQAYNGRDRYAYEDLPEVSVPDRSYYRRWSSDNDDNAHMQPSNFQPNPYAFRDQSRVHNPPSIKIPSFDGKGEWATWISQFEAIANRNRWSADDRLDQLLPRLEGIAAQFVFTQLRPEMLSSYRDLVAEMNSRFRTVETDRSYAVKFSRRVQHQGESVEDYAADLKRLYDKGHSRRDRRTRDEDLVRRFLDGLLDDELRAEIEFNKEPADIDEAVYHTVNLMQIRGSNRREGRGRFQARRAYHGGGNHYNHANRQTDQTYQKRGFDNRQRPNQNMEQKSPRAPATHAEDADQIVVSKLEARVKKLEGMLDAKGTNRSSYKRNVECFKCHKKGHYARECPSNDTETEGKVQLEEPLNMNGPHLAAKERSM